MMSGPSVSRFLLSLDLTEVTSSWSVNTSEPVMIVGWALAVERSLPLKKNSQIVIKVLFLISFYWLNLLPPPSMSTRQTITQAWSRKENRLVEVDF